ncbi:small lysine-rich protein 1 [Neoarius graeffei]|uniref:small lysine-rich protein 1 n=1 Tax=Neoarius graeffei TaxID=443677 RepID=UPI00298CBC34|nr:small lysine-rich protein 1 [Neoarius graeffei]
MCERRAMFIQPTGNKKSKSHSAKPKKKSDKKRPSKKRSASKTCAKPAVDILSPAAMKNAYYISHNAVDCLEFRGFGWPEATKKKGKGLKQQQQQKNKK